MARLRSNIGASFAGHLWVALMGMAFVPLYLRTLGAEAFGIVALMLTFQTLSLALDAGIAMFIGKEVAQRLVDPGRAGSIRQLVRSFEWLVWPMAILLGLSLAAASAPIAEHWLQLGAISQSDARDALLLTALVVALLWPTSFYAATLSGLEQQAPLNAVVVVFSTLRFAGVLPFIALTDSGLMGFIAWHAGVGATQTATTAFTTWSLLPRSVGAACLNTDEWRSAGNFASGVFTILVFGLALSHLDRLTLSVIRPIEELGEFMIAAALAGGLGRLVGPMFGTVYPRMCRLIAAGKDEQLTTLYHLASQAVMALVGSAGAVICLFASDVLRIWTGDPDLAERLRIPVALLFSGSVLNGLASMPFALQLAHGWTRLASAVNVGAVAAAVPLYAFGVSGHGVTGAAGVWLLINIVILVITIPLMHRHLMPGEATRWWARAFVVPAMTSFAVASISWLLSPDLDRSLGSICWLAGTAIMTLGASALSAPLLRRSLMDLVRERHKTAAPTRF